MIGYLTRIKDRPLVFDGAMGTMIYQKGVFLNACYDELSLSRPELVLEIHREYADAGAEVLVTNSFGANRIKLGEYGLAERAAEINRAAVEIARRAAPADVLVAGDVGPCSRAGQALDDKGAADVARAFEEQMRAQASAGVDLILLETFSCLRELQLAARIAKAQGVCVHASFTVDQHGETSVGYTAKTMVSALDRDPNVDTVGINCAIGPAGVFDILEEVIAQTAKPFVVKPNAGFPREVSGRMIYMSSPEYFTAYSKKFIELGAHGVGGCCGTTPAHIREMAKAVKALSGVKKHVEIRAVSEQELRAVEAVSPAKKSRFAARLLGGERVTSVELLPPRSSDMSALFAKARACHQAGIDAINIPDGPRASSRVSPLVTSILIKNEVGIEPIPHYCCRDRNLLGMQSDLLGGYAAGLANYLIVTGDPPKIGEYPDVTGVFDVDSIGLTRMIRNLNCGRDLGGNPVSPPTGIFIGVGANPCAVDPKREIDRYFQKIEAGAEFAITQPIFDPDSMLRFLEILDRHPQRIPVLAGVWPLSSFKNAEFLRNEVPGVVIPDPVMDRLGHCRTKEDSRKVGIDIAREIIARLQTAVAGFQVSAPLGNVQTALSVLGHA